MKPHIIILAVVLALSSGVLPLLGSDGTTAAATAAAGTVADCSQPQAAAVTPKGQGGMQSDPEEQKPGAYFVVCAVAKDQNEDIREWVQYHHWIGAEKIYLYDHNSSSPMINQLTDFVKAGVVEYTFFAGHNQRNASTNRTMYMNSGQGFAYADCLHRARLRRHEWAAFIDIDEFLVLYEGDHRNISQLLQQYESFGALAVNWRMFGNSGHLERPNLPTLQAYTKCHPVRLDVFNKHIKTIVHVPYTVDIGRCPHLFKYVPGKFAVTEDQRRCNSIFCKYPQFKSIGLHHYVTKSYAEYQKKLARGGGAGKRRTMDYWEAINSLAIDDCLHAVELSKLCCYNATQPSS